MFVAPLALALGLLPGQKVVPPAAVPLPGIAVRPVMPLPVRVLPGVAAEKPPSAPRTMPLASSAGGDEGVLKAARLDTSDEALLAFFRKRTPPAPDRATIGELARKLASRNAAERDAAVGELVSLGPAAVPVLRQAANNVDEVVASADARQCLHTIEGVRAPLLAIHAARLLAARKPAGSAEVLLGYLPFADDDTVFAEVESALVAVALNNGKPDPALLKALTDPVSLRRGTAAGVLCQAGGTAQHAAVRPLLKDSKPSVRLKAALGLVGAYDGEAIPVLIDLLAELPPRLRQQAEDYLTTLAGEWAVSGPRGNDLTSRRLRREIWAAWWKQTDGATLLEEFRSRTPTNDDYEKVLGLIPRLNADTPEAREAAARDLVAQGGKAASLLRQAVNRNHPRISPAAARVLEAIEKDAGGPLPTAAPRLLGLHKPEGTVAALLAYLPVAESESVTSQILDVLAGAGVVGGKPDEALVKGLEDPLAVRRAAAAVALCRGKAASEFPKVRKLLADKDADVRLKAARGLAQAGEREAVPVLIALLGELPLEQAWEVEDYLVQVAGEKSPTEVVSAAAEGRKKVVEAWQDWWKENSKTVELTRAETEHRELGFLVVVENWNPAKGRGRVLEVDTAGKVRWQIENLFWPYDAQVLRGGNVLVIEQQNRVTERNRKAEIVWDKYFSNVFHCDRLRNGHTFLGCRNQLLEVDRDGKPVFTHYYNTGTILAAKRFRDGSMAYVSYSGEYVKLDRTGKQIKRMQLPWTGFNVTGAEVLPNDHVIVSVSNSNKVVEFDADARPVWQAPVTNPLIPYRLSNGHTLVASHSNTALTEIDSHGKVISEKRELTYRPYRVFKR